MVNPELFAAYRDALSGCGTLVRAAVEAILGSIPEGATEAQAAALLLQAYPDELTRHGIIAADLARQFYQEQRDLEDGLETDYTARAAGEIPRLWGIEDVREAVTGARGTGLGALPGKAVKRTMQRADQTIYENSRRDPAHPRWAIVPHPGACLWCVMIGSRGFEYRTSMTADAQRHANCKCTPVCDFADDPHLDGYDPRALKDRYDQALAAGEIDTTGKALGAIGRT